MDFRVEKTISNFIENQFPSFYYEEGKDFMLFVKAYYEWMEEENNPIKEARELFNYRDIDSTLDKFLEYFQRKYLYGIPFQIITNKRFLLKHILDVYRSKGSLQSYKLLFKLVYGEDIDIYLPSEDMLKPSDGIWIQPRYLELTDNSDLSEYVGKEIIGTVSKTSAVVESFIHKKLINRTIAVLYISNVSPLGSDFSIGEKIIVKSDLENTSKLLTAPSVLGSLDIIRIINGGEFHKIGDIFKIEKNDLLTKELISNGMDGQVRASSLSRRTSIGFELIDGGFGYKSNSDVFVLNNIEDKTGTGGSFTVGSLVFQQPITYNNDLICNAVLANGVINDASYTYFSNSSANLSSTIGQTLSWSTDNFGSIGSLDNITLGINYTTNPSVLVRSTLDSNILPGNVSYSSSNVRVYEITYSGVPTGYSNSDTITIVNPSANGTNATANIITNNSSSLTININNYGSNFDQVSSNVIVSTANGSGVIFKPLFLPYVTGVNTKFDSVLSNNSILILKANSSMANTEKVVVKQVVNATSLFLYSNPTTNSTASARYAISPTILPSNFALYSNTMVNFNNEVFGENEVIQSSFSSLNDSVDSVKPLDSGFGYSDQEVVKAYMYGSISNNFTIVNSGSGYANNEKISFIGGGYPTVIADGYILTNANGNISNVVLTKVGSGYDYAPSISIKTSNGTNGYITCSLNSVSKNTEITGKVVLKGSGVGRGYWETTKGFLNSNKYIQDSYYYQDFSYEIQAARTLDSYKNILYNTFHTVGAELFGKVLINDSNESLIELKYEETTIT